MLLVCSSFLFEENGVICFDSISTLMTHNLFDAELITGNVKRGGYFISFYNDPAKRPGPKYSVGLSYNLEKKIIIFDIGNVGI